MVRNHYQPRGSLEDHDPGASGKRLHRIDGTAAKHEGAKLVRIATLEDGRLAMVGRLADLRDPVLGASGERTRTTGSKGRNFFEQALDIWPEDRL